MTDEEFVHAFEAATLPADQFTHAVHVRVAWWYLRHYTLGEALTRFTAALKHFAAHHGATGLYHETITVAYVLLIAERLAATRDLSWPDFSAAYPELLARRPSLLDRYYDEATLKSPQARQRFVMPVRVCPEPDARVPQPHIRPGHSRESGQHQSTWLRKPEWHED